MEKILGMMFEGILNGVLNENEEKKPEENDAIEELLCGVINGIVAQ